MPAGIETWVWGVDAILCELIVVRFTFFSAAWGTNIFLAALVFDSLDKDTSREIAA